MLSFRGDDYDYSEYECGYDYGDEERQYAKAQQTMGGRWEEGALHWRQDAHGQVEAGRGHGRGRADSRGHRPRGRGHCRESHAATRYESIRGYDFDNYGNGRDEYARRGTGRQQGAGGSRVGRGGHRQGARGRARGRELPAAARFGDESIVKSTAKATLSTEDTKRSEDEGVKKVVTTRKWHKTPESRGGLHRDVCLSDRWTVEGVSTEDCKHSEDESTYKKVVTRTWFKAPTPGRRVATATKSEERSGDKMQVLRAEGGQLKLTLCPKPVLESSVHDLVLVRVEYVAIDKSDVRLLESGASYIPGTNAMGTILEVTNETNTRRVGKHVQIGNGVDFAVGSGVDTAGTFRQCIVACSKQLVKVTSDQCSTLDGTCLDLLGDAYAATRKLALSKEQNLGRNTQVLIFGTNTEALFSAGILELHRELGTPLRNVCSKASMATLRTQVIGDGQIIVVSEKEESEERKALIRQFGAYSLLKWESSEALALDLAKLTADGRVSHILDWTGDLERVKDCVSLVRDSRRVVLATKKKGPPKIKKRMRIRIRRALRKLRGIELADAIETVVPLSNFDEAFKRAANGRVVVDMWK